MQTSLKVFVIVALAIVTALGLYVLVQTEFSMSMGPGGFSPGFSWLLGIRAAENGGQIAPSLDQLGASGDLPPFMAGAAGALPGAGGRSPAALSKGLEVGKAPGVLLRDLGLMAFAIVIAVCVEGVLTFLFRLKRRMPVAH